MPSTFKILTYRAFEPTEISGLKGWYDASTLTGADGSAVSEWLDSSGNEANMFQSTTAAQPSLQTAELNGKNVVRFDGIDDFMNLTAPLDTQPTSVGDSDCVAFSPDGNYLAFGNGNISPRIFIYKRNGNRFSKLANPAILPTGAITSVSWSNDNQFLCVTHLVSPFITIYQRSGDTFTKISDPAILPPTTANNSHFSANGNFLAVTSASSPFITIYSISGTTFTKLTDPAILPTGIGRGVAFSPDGNYLTVGMDTSPYIYNYSISGTTFTKLTDPTLSLSGSVRSVSWKNNSLQFAVAAFNGAIVVYELQTGLFQRIVVVTPIGLGAVRAVRYSKNNDFLAAGDSGSPFVDLYSVSGNTYTPVSNPASLPLGGALGVSWSNDDSYLAVAHFNAPYLQIYKNNNGTLINLNRLNMMRNVSGGTVFMVKKHPSYLSSQVQLFISISGSSTYRYMVGSNTSATMRVSARRLDSDGFNFNSGVLTYDNNFNIFSSIVDYANSNLFMYKNGATDFSSTSFLTDGNTSNTDSLDIRIGSIAGTSFFNGDIAEIIIYNRVLTAAEMTNVHEYLSRKWGITLA